MDEGALDIVVNSSYNTTNGSGCSFTWDELIQEWSASGYITGSGQVTNAAIHLLSGLSFILNCIAFLAYRHVHFPQSCFLQNLAVADGILPVVVIFQQWLPPFVLIDRCHVNYGCAYFYSNAFGYYIAAMSLLSLAGLVANHMIAILYPFNYPDLLSTKRTALAFICLWGLPLVCIVFITLYAFILYSVADDDANEPFCEVLSSDDVISVGRFVWIALALLVIIIIVGFYSKVYIVAKRSSSWKGRVNKDGEDVKRNIKALKTTVFLLVSLILSWCFIVACMAAITYGLDDSMHHLAVDMFHIWLIINTISDPIIVILRVQQVKVAYRQLFRCCLAPGSGRQKSASVTTITSFL